MGSSGVQRPLKFIKYLRDYNWQPIVIAPHPGAYHTFDESLSEEFNRTHTPVYRVDAKTPFHIAGKSSTKIDALPGWLQKTARTASSFFYLPDNKTGWIKPAVEKALQVIKEHHIELIFSTSPPQSNHMIAARVKQQTGIPAIMDFRDDWLEYPLSIYPTRFHKRKNAKIEKETVGQANGVVANNQATLDSISSRVFPQNEIPAKVITHGFDPEDFEGINQPENNQPEKIKFLYSGIFYEERKPDLFLEALSELIAKGHLTRDELEIHFQGGLDEEAKSTIKKFGLENITVDYGQVDHKNAVKNLFKADILWLIIKHRKKSDTVTPGKIYEYIATRKPILGLIPEGASRHVINSYKAGFICNPESLEEIKSTLGDIITQWRNSTLPKPDERIIQQYNRHELTGDLASFFDTVVNS